MKKNTKNIINGTTKDYYDLLHNCGQLITFVKFFDEHNDPNGHTVQVEELLLKIKDSIKKVYDILTILEHDFRKKKKWNLIPLENMTWTNSILIDQYKSFIKKLKNGEPILDVTLRLNDIAIRKPNYPHKIKEHRLFKTTSKGDLRWK